MGMKIGAHSGSAGGSINSPSEGQLGSTYQKIFKSLGTSTQ